MLKITVITVGNLKEKYLRDAAAEYEKRLAAYGKITVEELKEERLPENPSENEISAALSKEGEKILSLITPKTYAVAMAIEGKMFSSEELAAHLAALQVNGHGEFAFIIGSSHGLADSVKKRCDLLLSVSRLTFPHQLMRPLLLEIIYRCLSINAGTRYHK